MEFNFISSWFVYGEGQLPYTENQCCNPKGFYSITKLAAEQLLKSYCETFGIRFRIIRLGNVFGSGDHKASARKNALTYLVERIRANEEVKLYENGEILRDYIHVEDVCRGIDLIINDGKTNEIFNLSSGIPTNLGQLLRDYAYKIQSKSKFTAIDTPDFHKLVQVKDSFLNVDKITELGLKLKRPISIEELEVI